jgi:hypothetical protein
MAKTMLELAENAASQDLSKAYGPAQNAEERKEQAARFTQTEKLMKELLRPTGNRPKSAPSISMKEAVHTADFKILFPKVVSDTLQLPQEPMFVGQNLIARTIQVDGARVMEFPEMGALRAYEISDTQEPPEQDPAFSKNITEIRVRRFGLKLELSNELVEESQWDVLGLMIQNAGNALRRKKEELIWNEYELRAQNMFDNSSTNTAKWTRGKAANGITQNASFDHEDLLDMIAALGANGYQASDIVLHPLAWSIWAKDPFLRFQLLHQGGVGQTFGQPVGTGADQHASAYVPFNLNVVVTPFQTVSLAANPGTGTATGSANYTTITVLDRQQSMLILQRQPVKTVSFENPVRDLQTIAFHEKYGLAVLNGGRSATTAKNIKLTTNYQPLYSVRNVTAA